MTLAPSLVVDTNVASYFIKEPSHGRAAEYEPLLSGHTWLLSFMSLAELWQWAEIGVWSDPRRYRMRSNLAQYIIVPSKDGLCETWAYLMGLSKRGGHNLGHADAWLAATSLVRDAPLASDNVRHSAWIPGLRLITL